MSIQSLLQKATPRNNRKQSALSRKNNKESAKRSYSRTQKFPRLKRTLSLKCKKRFEGEWQRTCLKNSVGPERDRFLGALCTLEYWNSKPRSLGAFWTRSGVIPEIYWENQKTHKKKRSQNDSDLQTGVPMSQPLENFDPDEASYIMAEDHWEIPNCSSESFSGRKVKCALRVNGNSAAKTPLATIETEQILSALHQLATNSNSVNFNIRLNIFSKLPKSITTTMPTFDRKTEKFEQFENFFRTNPSIHTQLTDDHRTKYFQSTMQTLRTISSPTREKMEEAWAGSLKKYVKPQSMVLAKRTSRNSSST